MDEGKISGDQYLLKLQLCVGHWDLGILYMGSTQGKRKFLSSCHGMAAGKLSCPSLRVAAPSPVPEPGSQKPQTS